MSIDEKIAFHLGRLVDVDTTKYVASIISNLHEDYCYCLVINKNVKGTTLCACIATYYN